MKGEGWAAADREHCQEGRHALGLSEGEQGDKRAQEIVERTEQLEEMGQMRWNLGFKHKGELDEDLGQVVALAKFCF